MAKVYIKFILTLILIVNINSCDDKHQVVPNVYVNFYISIYDPEFIELAAPGNSISVTGGVNGVLIYRVSQDEFVAYDRTCTFSVADNCQIITDETGLFASDTICCQSKFLLLDGSITDGPATYPLKKYRTTFDGTYLHVFN